MVRATEVIDLQYLWPKPCAESCQPILSLDLDDDYRSVQPLSYGAGQHGWMLCAEGTSSCHFTAWVFILSK
jgi:hypothetical protein